MIHFSSVIAFSLFLLFTYFIHVVINKRFEICLPISVCLIILIMYALGWIGKMKAGLFITVGISVAGAFFLVRDSIKKQVRRPGPAVFLLFAIYFCALFLHTRETEFGWDEAAHWLLTVKNSYVLDAFGSSGKSNLISTYRHYLPGCALFEYWFTKLSGRYSNAIVRIAICVMTGAFLAPFGTCIREDASVLRKGTFCALLLSAPFVFYRHAYNSVTVDLVMGLCCAWCVYSVLYFEEWFRLIMLAVGIIVLCLIKDAGILVSYFILLLLLIRGDWRTRRCAIVSFACLFFLPLVVRMSWGIYLARQGWDLVEALVGRSIEGSMRAGIPAFAKEGFRVYWKALLWDACRFDSVRFYYFLIPVPYSVILFFVSMLLYTGLKGYSNNKNFSRTVVCLLPINILWAILVSMLYLLRFTESEVAILSSASRYLGILLLPTYLIGLSLLFRKQKDDRFCSTGILLSLLLFANPGPLVSDAYLDSHRASPLLRWTETDEDRRYREKTEDYSRLLSWIQDWRTPVVIYGHGNIHWMLLVVAPNPCARSAIPEGFLDRIRESGQKECLVFMDDDSDIKRLVGSGLISKDSDPPVIGGIYTCTEREGTLRLIRLE